MRLLLFVLLLVLSSCKSNPSVEPIVNWNSDLQHVRLDLDRELQSAVMTLDFQALSDGLSLETKNLSITSAMLDGSPVEFLVDGGRTDFATPEGSGTLEIEYGYQQATDYNGFLDEFSFLWPYHCGAAMPCKSSPEDGITFELLVESAIQEKVEHPSPSYMLAWALDNHTYTKLGTTPAGTEVGFYALPNGQTAGQAGSANLLAAFEWLETTLGPYPYGKKAASVEVAWGEGAFGGMEHHPYWHIGSDSFADEETHVHEAVHGWFGNGIRMKCWEDFVLSEGVTTYLSIRALEAVGGPSLWQELDSRLQSIQGSNNKVAWPAGCNSVDIIESGLYSDAPYTKGALFLKSVADVVGAEVLDQTLSGFFAKHKGKAMRFQDLLDEIKVETNFDVNACAIKWLRDLSPQGHELVCVN